MYKWIIVRDKPSQAYVIYKNDTITFVTVSTFATTYDTEEAAARVLEVITKDLKDKSFAGRTAMRALCDVCGKMFGWQGPTLNDYTKGKNSYLRCRVCRKTGKKKEKV